VYSLIDPVVPITPGASGVHGITADDVVDAPTIEEFLSIVEPNNLDRGEIVIVAHKADFDLQYVGPHIGNLVGTICTLKCARKIYPDADDHKLQTLRYALNLRVEAADAHSALEMSRSASPASETDAGQRPRLEGLMEISKAPTHITKMGFGKHKGVKLTDLPTITSTGS